METEGSKPLLQKPSTCHYTEHCCMTAARNGGIFILAAMRTKPNVIIHDMESQVVINISEHRDSAMYSEPEVQVFPKLLKHLTKLHIFNKRETVIH
jgi:hypothetical protein